MRALVDAGLAVLRRAGFNGLTVADVLTEAGLSTRAFYRHFGSKSELVLSVYEHELARSLERLHAALAAAGDSRAALEAWIDMTLGLAYDPRRARRTRVLWTEGQRLRTEFPRELARIGAGEVAPLVDVLDAGRRDGTFPHADPVPDARSIHAVVWSAAEAKLAGEGAGLAEARAHCLRFCLRAVGARP